jgi:holo-[acyl-carrier protein] synthase
MRSGQVLGTGVDLVETQRMFDVLSRWGGRFKNRVFLSAEQDYCETRPNPCRHYAARFAVKEAVSKAFGTGLGRQLGWLDIEVIRNPGSGAPSVRLSPRARRFARDRCAGEVLVSLSHTDNYAVAHALLIGGDEGAPGEGWVEA